VRSRFEQSVRLFSTAQMAIVDKADYPTEEIAHNSHKLRPIGTNYGDLGALVMKLGYGYDSNEGRAIAAQMASLMTGMVYLTAAKLAARVGAFPDYELNREDMLRVMKMHQEADASIMKRWQLESSPTGDDVISTSAEVWREAIALGERYGYSVSQASLQAPLGTISFLMGMNTTGIEPAIALVSYKKLVGGGYMKLVNHGVRDALEGLGYAEDQIERICKYIEEKGGIEGAPDLKEEHLSVFDCALPSENGTRYLSPMAHIKMMAAIQPLITCAMSKTVNLPKEITADEIAKIYEESWRLGLKCIALYRDGCKASQPVNTKKDVELKFSDSNPAPAANPLEQLITEAKATGARREKLPSEVNSWRHKFEIDGYKGYIIVGEYADGRPGEVFLKLGKPGSTISGLIDGFTQLMSIALQYGVPLPKLIQSFIDTRFEPAGMTSNKHIRFAKSLYDYLFKVLDVRYYGGHHSGLKERLDAIKASEPPAKDVREGMSKEPESSTRMTVAEEVHPPRKSLDAPACARCGSITQRNGSCYLCTSCGTTTGCS
jgi:ribonucleoside-diphosphate reductase alpha chain